MPAPFEDVDGVTIEYWNNPTQFIQPHIGLFQRERRFFHRYQIKMLDFDEINLRWLQAEDWYERWIHKYEADEIAKANRVTPNADHIS